MREIGVKAPMPGFIEPQLATLKTKPPKGDYLHEIKFDGYRAQVHMVRGSAKIFTRSGLDWTRRFGPIVDALDYDVSAILEGEIVVVEDNRCSRTWQMAAGIASRSTCSTSCSWTDATSGRSR